MTLKDFTYHILPIKDKLYRFALRIVGNVAEAEDVVQEVFIKTWNQRKEIENVKNKEAWCMRLTKNLSIDKLRSKHHRTDPISEVHTFHSAKQSPYQQTEINDTMSLVERLMYQLPEKQRTALQLRDIDGYSYQEIAEILEVSVDQIKVNLYRARQAIKKQLINKESYGI